MKNSCYWVNKFKKNSLMGLCLVLVAIFCVLSNSVASAASVREKVNISYYNDSGFYVLDENGELTGGSAYDLQAALNRYLNWDTKYVYGDWKDSLENVRTGKTDVIFGAFKTADREKNYVFSKEPIAQTTNYVCGRADEKFLNGDYTKLRGKRFGLIKGALLSKQIKDFLDKKNIKVTYVMGNSSTELKNLLSNNKIDYFVINNAIINYDEKILQKFSVVPRYVMATKDKKNLMLEFDLAIEKMRFESPELMKKILSKTYKSKSLNISNLITEDEKKFIKTAKVIRCGVIENNAPYYYKDSNGNVEGIVKVVTDKIQKDSGLKFVLIPFKDANAEIEALKESKIDAIGMVANNSYNVQKYNLNLSYPYIDSDVVILKSKNKINNKNIKNLYAIKRSPFENEMKLKFEMPGAKFKKYDTDQKSIDALNRGEVGATIIGDFNANMSNKKLENIDNLVSYFANGISFEYCIGFSNKIDVRYLEISDKVIANLDSSDVKLTAINNVDSSYEKKTLEMFFFDYKMQILAIIALIIILLVVLYLKALKFERAKLRLGDERFKKISKQAQVSYWEYSYAEKKLTFFDDNWVKRHGLKKNVIENYDIEKRKDYFDEKTIQKMIKVAALMETEDEKELQIKAKGIDGKDYYYIMKISAIRDNFGKLIKALGSILDVTDAKNILNSYEKEVKRNEVMGSMLLASFMFNLSKNEVTANSDCLIAKKDELIGISCDELFENYFGILEFEEQKKFFRDLYTKENLIDLFNKGRRDSTAFARVNYGGKLKWVEVAIHKTQDPFTGDIMGIIYVRDAKERETLQSALDLAEAANYAKSNFLSSVSHEIRTPMNAIMGLTNMAIEDIEKTKEKDSKIYDKLSNIKLSSEYLLLIINDILEMSRIESGKTKLNKKVYDCSEFIKTVIAIISMSAREKNIEFTYTPDKNFQRYYIGDEVKTKKILINILGNAIKFTPRNGKVEYTSKIISYNEKRTIVRIVVTDNGIGISEEFLKHIFEPFTRERSNETEYQGTGLGMAITQNFIKMMDGDIKIESELGKGTTVTITFAVENYDESTNNIIPKKEKIELLEIEKEKLNKAFKGFKVLLVEDNKLNAIIAAHLLAKMGFEIETATNGQMAIDMFKDNPKDYYFAILMDIRMPIMDGLEATKVIRNLDREDAKTIPIVAMTANAFDVDRRNSLEAGMNEHVTKPIEVDKLSNILASFIKN